MKKCSICKQDILPDLCGWTGGHNAQPVNNGRCCGDCNSSVVIPRRYIDMKLQSLLQNIKE